MTDAAAQGNAPQSRPHKHHHYQLVDLGSTFGGPNSYFVPGSGDAFPGSSVLSSRGTVVGFADTSASDPFPTFYFSDRDVVHAFQAGSSGHLTDLGALPGGGSSAPMWISANGLIAGLSENGETDPLYAGLPQDRAVLWQHGTITDLGTLPEGGYQSEANAVNSSGQVVGAALNTIPDTNSMQSIGPGPGAFLLWSGITPPYQYQMRAFLWDKQTGMQDLGTLPGGTDAQAIFINEKGQVVGHSYTSSTQRGACYLLATGSFIWEKDKGMRDLGGFGGTCTLAAYLNNQGQVVGESNLPGDQSSHAFLWEHDLIKDLGGSLGGNNAGAFAVNDEGQAVGFATLPGEATFHATLWTHVGNFTDLGVLGNDICSYAAVINVGGQVVGGSSSDCHDVWRAFLWEDGGPMVDLNSLIPPGAALYLQKTYAINDEGEIAGTGVEVDGSGNQHAFTLIPCDQDHLDISGCDYDLVDEGSANASSSMPMTLGLATASSTQPLISGKTAARDTRIQHRLNAPAAAIHAGVSFPSSGR
jgi:probable HAF family extracellular repeat protein